MSVAEVECTQCGRGFEVDTTYFQTYGTDPFCPDCLIHTECHDCGRGLRLQPSRYGELGGDPVICTDCGQSRPSHRENAPPAARPAAKPSFWHGLTIGEKILFPIVVLVGIASVFALVWYPEVTARNVGSLIAGCVILMFWLLARGEKNTPNT